MSQEHIDRYYFANGKCCAGCDWWRSYTSILGECTVCAPVAASERWAMAGVEGSSLPLAAPFVNASQ